MERKDKVKLLDGTEKEVNIGFLSFQKRNEILQSCSNTKMSGTATESNFDIFKLQSEVLKHTMTGASIDEITADSGDALFINYFAKAFGMDGGGSKKN